MKRPLISIIVPCYNHAQYLDEALQSVIEQSYNLWECIIVNDGSLDNTEEIALKWKDKDERFVYLKKENEGLSSARNSGIRLARGEFILPLDADDKISEKYVEKAIKSFLEDDLLKVVYCKAEKFGNKNEPFVLKPFSLLNLAKQNIIFCSGVFRKNDWKVVHGYDVQMKFGFEDWEFWIALLKTGAKVKCLDYLGFYYRIKSSSMLNQLDKEKEKYLMEYLSVKHADFFVKQLGSFHALEAKTRIIEKNFIRKLKSEKFVIDIFCKKFFGFTIFGKYKQDL